MENITINSFNLDLSEDFEIKISIPDKVKVNFELFPLTQNGLNFLGTAGETERKELIKHYLI